MFLAETELITGGVSMYPTLETIRQLAQTKEYRRIPLCRELYADRYTPVEVMRICEKPAAIVTCWKVPARQKCGAGILFWGMNRPWRLPVQTEH